MYYVNFTCVHVCNTRIPEHSMCAHFIYVYTYEGRKNTKRTQRRGHYKKYVLIPEVNILGRKNTKRTQRRGRNVWAWVG